MASGSATSGSWADRLPADYSFGSPIGSVQPAESNRRVLPEDDGSRMPRAAAPCGPVRRIISQSLPSADLVKSAH